ncbi:MAG TPA: hypothetical protein VMS12_02875 [Thermoanaerobaculia bacterium]|nr:hypothetical protein [Thermoanaerobaculia bacterium]
MTKKLILLSAVLLLSVLSPGSLTAAVSVSLSPPYIEKLMPSGGKLQDTISYTNDSDTPMLVTVDFADFGVSATGEVSEMPSGTDVTSLARSIRISPSKIQVPPGGRTFFRYSVTAPEEFTQLRSQIFFSSTPIVESAPNQVLFVARMGIPIYVENVKAQPADIKVHEVKWERSGENNESLVLKAVVTNEGERNIRPSGFLEVRSQDGRFAQTFPFNEGNEPVLPGQKREWTLSFGPVPGGELSLDLRFAIGPRAMFRERYTVQ